MGLSTGWRSQLSTDASQSRRARTSFGVRGGTRVRLAVDNELVDEAMRRDEGSRCEEREKDGGNVLHTECRKVSDLRG